jgi:hypothetical protein
MGSWIAHLQMAEIVFTKLSDLDEAAFTYGNLAPDSGVPNADWSEFDPPKEVTHFLKHDRGEDGIRDLDFFRAYVQSLNPIRDRWRYSFCLGYFSHLICDGIWMRLLVPTTILQSANAIAENPGAAWKAIKDDWYSLDRKYVRDHPKCNFWRVLMVEPNPPSPLPFLKESGLHHNLDYIRALNTDPNPDWVIDRRYSYLSEVNMSRISADCAALFLELFERRPEFGERSSALEILDPERLRPYEFSLGDQ